MHRIVFTLLLACMLALPMQTIRIYAEPTTTTDKTSKASTASTANKVNKTSKAIKVNKASKVNRTKELLLSFTEQVRKHPLSSSQREHIKNLDDNTRDILTRCIQVLFESARDTNGQPVNPENITKDTIFVHSVINNKIGKQLKSIRGNELFHLFKVVNVIDIEPLTNAISYRIAQDIITLLRNAPNKMRDEVLSCFRSGQQPPKMFLIKAHLGLLNKEELMQIQKHLYLLQHQKTELSIADYIGKYGQPGIYDGELNLSRENLTSLNKMSGEELAFTSLSGIELIKNAKQVKELNLEKNFLLGVDMDPAFPRNGLKSFTSLRIVKLSHNRLSQLPSKFFRNNRTLREIHLDHNQLTDLPDNLLFGLSELKELHLGSNQISGLPNTMFSISLDHLEELYLEHNPIQRLPRDLFSYLPNLKWLYLDHEQSKRVMQQSTFFDLQRLGAVDIVIVDKSTSTNNVPIQSQPDHQLESTNNPEDTDAKPQAKERRISTSWKKISSFVVHGLQRLIPILTSSINVCPQMERPDSPHKGNMLFDWNDFSSSSSISEDDDDEELENENNVNNDSLRVN